MSQNVNPAPEAHRLKKATAAAKGATNPAAVVHPAINLVLQVQLRIKALVPKLVRRKVEVPAWKATKALVLIAQGK